MIVQREEELLVAHDLVLPLRAVHRLQLFKGRLGEFQSFPMHVLVERSPADWRFLAQCSSANSIHNPPEHTHVFRISGPEEFPVLILAKPVDVEDSWSG